MTTLLRRAATAAAVVCATTFVSAVPASDAADVRAGGSAS